MRVFSCSASKTEVRRTDFPSAGATTFFSRIIPAEPNKHVERPQFIARSDLLVVGSPAGNFNEAFVNPSEVYGQPFSSFSLQRRYTRFDLKIIRPLPTVCCKRSTVGSISGGDGCFRRRCALGELLRNYLKLAVRKGCFRHTICIIIVGEAEDVLTADESFR
jgi:hypothetical protein